MNKKGVIIIGILSSLILLETWLLSTLWKAENNIIPSVYNTYTSLSDTGVYDNFVIISGTWFSETKLAYPVQASKIECSRDKGTCIEAQATVKDNYLNVDTMLYEITLWNENEIIAKQGASCKVNELKINRKQKQATLTSTIKNTDGICGELSKEPTLLYLMNGFDAWQKNKLKS